jgi:hypothetical protein
LAARLAPAARRIGQRRAVVPLPLIATAAVALILALAPEMALARAGGGSHGGGGSLGGGGFGGGGGFSGGGGGGGLGGLLFLPFLFGGGGGIFIIVVAIWLLARLFGGGGMGGGYTGGYSAPVYGAPPGSTVDYAGIEAIQAADPGFNQQVFMDRVQAVFFLMQKAWQDSNVDEGRAYMSPGLYQSWRAQVDAMTAAHKRNVLENLYIQGLHIVRASHDQNFDNITVRIDASAMDYEVDDQTGKVVFGEKRDAPFTEFWTFTRSAGVKTLVTGGISEQKCPNCGAPLSVNEVGSCRYCNAAVTSGNFDWVLSRIDQANEFGG